VSEYDLLLHGDLWDAEHGRREATWLAIRKDQIEGVYDDKPGPAATERHVDVLTPGLMDLHVHLVWDGSGDPVATLRDQSEQEQTVQAVANARAQLQGEGVTTARDLGSTHDIAISVAAAVRRGDVPGPRVYASGRTVIISGGHDPFWGIPSDGVDAVRTTVRRLRNNGAHLIKVSATGGVYGQAIGEDPGTSELSRKELTTIVEEADRFGLPVAAHAVGTEGIANAVAAGVDTIEHGNLMYEETLDRMEEQDIAYEPTLYIYRYIAQADTGVPEYARENAKRVYEHHWEVFENALASDVRILAGSDAGSPDLPHPGLHRELACLVEGGMTEAEALAAATTTLPTNSAVPGWASSPRIRRPTSSGSRPTRWRISTRQRRPT